MKKQKSIIVNTSNVNDIFSSVIKKLKTQSKYTLKNGYIAKFAGYTTDLPDLPKQNRMSESSSSLKFRKWWQLHGKNAPYEMKDTRGTDSFPFDELSAEQEAFALSAGSSKGVLIRVEKGTIGSPDYVGFRNTVSYVVIKFKSGIEVITINNFIRCRETCGRKSLTHNQAKSISSVSIK